MNTEGAHRLIDDPHRIEGMTALGIDEHGWRYLRGDDKYVSVIIDLSPIRSKTDPAKLLYVVEGSRR